MCGVGRGESLTLDVDGQVYGCALFAESFQTFPGTLLSGRLPTLRLGELGDAEFERRLAAYPAAVERTELFDHQEEKYSSFRKCSECSYLGSCEICPVAIGNIPGNEDPRRIPDFLCALSLVSSRYRERFHDLCDPYEWLTNPSKAAEFLQELWATA